MKIISSKNVLRFCGFLFLSLLNLTSFAQIIYTDIPDATPSATFSLDLNNDNIEDFIIQYSVSSGTIGVICQPQNNNAYSGSLVSGNYLPWALSSASSICDTLSTWYTADKPGTLALGSSLGNWVGQSNKYLALKLIVGSNTYYGWARLDVDASSASFTIKDYAYQSTPNACIEAGQIVLGIPEHSTQYRFSIFPNPALSTTNIQTTGHLNNASLNIFNMYGQRVKQVNHLSGQSHIVSLDNLPSGLYFIRLSEENKIIAEEILIITNAY
jgi:hypothetical protein